MTKRKETDYTYIHTSHLYAIYSLTIQIILANRFLKFVRQIPFSLVLTDSAGYYDVIYESNIQRTCFLKRIKQLNPMCNYVNYI